MLVIDNWVDGLAQCPSFADARPVTGMFEAFADAHREFWEAVQFGPIFTCCSCHETWFRKFVIPVTDSMIAKHLSSAEAMTSVLRWICHTCNAHLIRGKSPLSVIWIMSHSRIFRMSSNWFFGSRKRSDRFEDTFHEDTGARS